MSLPSSNEDLLDDLQQYAFGYFLKQTNPANGLVADKTRTDWPASIAATGFALAAYPVGVEHSYLTRAEAVERTLTTLRFFLNSPQGEEPGATGYRGFYYHFLEMETGRRAWNCELSTIDTTLLLAGALAGAMYFDGDGADERELRALADALYARADWRWAQDGGATVTHGWKPESGFLKYRWEGYDEALILYALGLGSPTHALPEESYAAWSSSYKWKKLYGHEFLYAGSLFTHQYSHLWIDFRGIQDGFMRDKGSDYFENSRRATYVQQHYATRNPEAFKGYGEYCWGITASDGPGPGTRMIDGVERRFFDYAERGVPYGPDDGTLATWAVVASLPFAPEIILPTLRYFNDVYSETVHHEGLRASFNPTYSDQAGNPWICEWCFGINQGPVVMMIENYRSELLWRLMRRCPYLVKGLRRAGFANGWLSKAEGSDSQDDIKSTKSVSRSSAES